MTKASTVIAAFAVSILGSAAFAAAYVLRAGLHWEGLGLLIALTALAVGIIVLALRGIPQAQTVNVLDEYPSDSSDRAGAEETLKEGIGELVRARFLLRFLFGAFGALGLAALFPFRSLAPGFGKGLYHTKWTSGARLVRDDGTPVHASELAVGSLVTVFPEGNTGDESSQTVLLRVPAGTIHASQGRTDWTPQGYVAFSKVCTHAGCPVGLYRSDAYELLCPCHQSVFDVVNEARPISGPAARPLPQLPLTIGTDGYVRAQSDYQEPIGPGFWQRS